MNELIPVALEWILLELWQVDVVNGDFRDIPRGIVLLNSQP